MSVPAEAFRKVYEYELLVAEDTVKFYRGLLGMPPVKNNADCAKEIESLKRQLQEKIEENEVLHHKVNDLWHKLCQAYRKRDELAEKLRNKSILDSVLVQKYEKQQIALNSDIGEAFECELDGKPFEKGYYLRLTKKEYELTKDDKLIHHIAFMKRSDE